VLLAITDNGAGMTQEVLRQAFDPFFTMKDIGQGTGLGLSQVYSFIKQSGGCTSVQTHSEGSLGDGRTNIHIEDPVTTGEGRCRSEK
jgi:C4-dicarboxylate-specific signal transduction histidine kinase